MKPFLHLGLGAFGVVAGVLAIYEVFQLFPTTGWGVELYLSLGVAAFMVVAGGAEVGELLSMYLASGWDTKRCRSCKAPVPNIARFCRECGRRF